MKFILLYSIPPISLHLVSEEKTFRGTMKYLNILLLVTLLICSQISVNQGNH